MKERYAGIAGCRLDNGTDNPNTGKALDLHGSLPHRHSRAKEQATALLWIRDDDNNQTEISLDAQDLLALYRGIGIELVQAGYAKLVTAAVPDA